MSYVTGTDSHRLSGHRVRNFFGAIIYSIAEFFFLIRKANMVAGDYEKLSRFSDRELKDIGLTRTELTTHLFAKHFA